MWGYRETISTGNQRIFFFEKQGNVKRKTKNRTSLNEFSLKIMKQLTRIW